MRRCRQAFCLLLAAVFLVCLPAAGFAGTGPEAGTSARTADAAVSRAQLRELSGADGAISFTAEIALPAMDGQSSGGQRSVQPEGSVRYSKSFYGDQLPDDARAIYDAIRESELWNGPAETVIDIASRLPEASLTVPAVITAICDPSGELSFSVDQQSEALGKAFLAASAALICDWPELSWLINTDVSLWNRASFVPTEADMEAALALAPGQSCTISSNAVRLSALDCVMDAQSVRMATTEPEENEAAVNPWKYAATGDRSAIGAAVAAAAAEIGPLSRQTDAAKVEAVHDWLCAHTEYADKSGLRFQNDWRGYQTAWSALVEGESVCAGYARAMKLLLDEYGIPCVMVIGQSQGEAHAWNYVQIGGRWYGLDATWADQAWGADRSDFLKGGKTFGQDHTEGPLAEGVFLRYPQLTADDYLEGMLPGDVNLDGTVNLTDIVVLTEAFGGSSLSGAALANGDLNSSGGIDLADIVQMAKLLWDLGASQGAASGSAQAVRIEGPSAVQPGEEIRVTVSGKGHAVSGRLQTAGLDFVSVSSELSHQGGFVLLPDYGTSSVTYTFRVQAEGGSVCVQMEDGCEADGSTIQRIAPASWTAPVSVPPAQSPDVTPAPGPSASASARPSATALPTAGPGATTKPSASVMPSPAPTSAVPKPSAVPAPEIPEIAGYQGGIINGRPYYVKTSGSRTMFYLRRNDGTMNRVAAPYVTGSDGSRYYPVSCGSTVLFPRLTDGKLSAYCVFRDGMEIPVLAAGADIPEADSLQSCTVGARSYLARVSGSRMMFYLQRQDGTLNRVAAPYVMGSDGSRYYPVNCGGIVLSPQSAGGNPVSYTAGTVAVLTPAA